jgi:hypothetical protein
MIPGSKWNAMGIKGKNSKENTTKTIVSTTAKMKTDGINITNATAEISNAM